MNDQTLNSLLETVWQQIARGTADRNHPARHPTLATITPDGPDMRTLVLRAASRTDQTLEFHTDATSPKAAQIHQNPTVAIHFWIPKSSLQIRARATATLLPGDPALFAQLPEAARQNYQGPAPGASLPTKPSTQENRFTRILCQLTNLDALLLTTPHKRASYCATTDWHGTWIAP